MYNKQRVSCHNTFCNDNIGTFELLLNRAALTQPVDALKLSGTATSLICFNSLIRELKFHCE